MSGPVLHRLATCAAIAAAAAGLYGPAASAWFFQDDLQWLAGTLTFRPASLLDLSGHSHFYRPVISMYFWAATPVLGGSPTLFHWANIALHAINAVLVFELAAATGFRRLAAGFAALCFLSMPAHIEATAWVSALAEPVTTFFGLVSVRALLLARQPGRRSPAWMLVSIGGFSLALMTHESAAVLLPLLVIADWAFASRGHREHAALQRDLTARVRRFAPYVVILLAYLIADLSVNRRSYLVEEGHYRFGAHAIGNLFGYVVTLYAGKRNVTSYIVAGLALAALLLRGTPRVRFATAWLLLSLVPFSFFTWSNTSRYAYMPAVGMALLLAEALDWLDGRLARRAGHGVRLAVVLTLGAFVVIRFMVFAAENIRHFTERTEPYRRFAAEVRRRHPDPPPGARIPVDRETADALQFRYVEALVQWELKDPAVTVVVEP